MSDTDIQSGVSMSGRRLSIARRAVHWYLYHNAMVRSDQSHGAAKTEALTEMRAAQGLLDVIGWPGGGGRTAEIEPTNIAMVRRAVLMQLRAEASNIYNAVDRALSHPETPFDMYHWGNLQDFDDYRKLLDGIGWEMA